VARTSEGLVVDHVAVEWQLSPAADMIVKDGVGETLQAFGHRRPSATGFEFASMPAMTRLCGLQNSLLKHTVKSTANDAISVSTESLINTPFDFRWYRRRGIPPSACSGAPGVCN
jgi:hypothetical protein